MVLSNSLTPDVIDIAMANIGRGADAAGRDLDDIEIWWMCNMVPAPTEEEGIDSIKAILAGTANHVYRFHMEGKGLPDEVKDRIALLQGEYDSSHHANPATAAHNAALVEKYDLVDFLAPRGSLAGPTGHLVQRLHEVIEAGATNLIFSQFVDDPLAWMRLFATDIAPEFR